MKTAVAALHDAVLLPKGKVFAIIGQIGRLYCAMTPPFLPIGLIVNANARRVRRRFLRRHRFWQAHLPDTAVRITHTMQELDETVSAFKSQGVQIVACLGGDGTLSQTIGSLYHYFGADRLPIVLPLAGGTLNGATRALGTAGQPDGILLSALEAIKSGNLATKVQCVLKISNACDDREQLGFTFAAGLAARATKLYYRRAHPTALDAVRVSCVPVTAAVSGSAFYASVDLAGTRDGKPLLPDAHTVVAGVLENPFLWFKPFGDVERCDGFFHVTTVSMRPAQIAFNLWKLFRGRYDHPGLCKKTATALSLKGTDGYVMDGELFSTPGGFDIRLTLGPSIRVLDLSRTDAAITSKLRYKQ